MNLNDKAIMVVGAAGRLGREIVTAALAHGASITAIDSDLEALERMRHSLKEDSRLACHAGDIGSADSIDRAIEAALGRSGRLDGAVNTTYPRNAAYGRAFLEVGYEDFCENLSLHLGGYFLLMQRCAKYSIEHDTAFSLVNLSSVYGVIAPRFEIYSGTAMTMPVEYAAIKAGLIHLTRYASAYAKGTRFRANCVSPGGVLDGQDPSFLERYGALCQRKGMLEPRDVAGAVLFLLSDLSEFVVGQNVIVDDGFSL